MQQEGGELQPRLPPAGELRDRAVEVRPLQLELPGDLAAPPVRLPAVPHQEPEGGLPGQERVVLAEVTQPQTRVAENDSTDSATLERLSLSDSSEVRAAVAQNEHTLRSTVLTLAEDLSSDVRYALAENAGTNMALLELLSLDENPYVQGRAIRTKARVLADEAYLTACGRA